VGRTLCRGSHAHACVDIRSRVNEESLISRVASGRACSARRIHRHQRVVPGRAGGRLLQQWPRIAGAVDRAEHPCPTSSRSAYRRPHEGEISRFSEAQAPGFEPCRASSSAKVLAKAARTGGNSRPSSCGAARRSRYGLKGRCAPCSAWPSTTVFRPGAGLVTRSARGGVFRRDKRGYGDGRWRAGSR
jgi:hypothetical protein